MRAHKKIAHNIFSLTHPFFSLPPQITESCLLSVFELFLRDLDEVKVGVLRNFGHFLRVLSLSRRSAYLPVLQSINSMESSNWRFRRLIAKYVLLLSSSLFFLLLLCVWGPMSFCGCVLSFLYFYYFFLMFFLGGGVFLYLSSLLSLAFPLLFPRLFLSFLSFFFFFFPCPSPLCIKLTKAFFFLHAGNWVSWRICLRARTSPPNWCRLPLRCVRTR